MPVDSEITAAVEHVAAQLDTNGATVQYVSGSELGDLHRYFSLYMAMMAVMSSARTGEGDRRAEAERRRSTGDPFDAAWATGLLASAQDYVMMEAQREEYRLRFRTFFQRFDVLLTPVNLVNAFPHRDDPYLTRRLSVGGASAPYEYQGFFAGLANLSGHPATAFPAGLTEEGLPIGLQAVGPYLLDKTCIRFCALLEAECGGFRPPPHFPAELESMGH
jgi:amidase